jgi:hypothetical protein
MNNINMDLLEIGLCGVDWICLAQDKEKWKDLMTALMKIRAAQLLAFQVVLSSTELVS